MIVHGVPTAPDLDTARTPPTDGSDTTRWRVMLSPQVIEHILKEKNYETVLSIARFAFETIVDLIRDDEIYPYNRIIFALDADGNPKLVDGQVLLEAALAAGWYNWWLVTCTWREGQTAERM